jgi:hypothetical protein
MKILHSIGEDVRPRPTLKLKTGPRMRLEEKRAALVPPKPNDSKSKAGAHWSDYYNQRMQQEMNELVR